MPSPARSETSVAELALERLRRDDLPAVAAIHMRAFTDSAITAFGAEAVRRYYAWLLDGPHDAALVGARQAGRLVGFCAAGVFRGAMNGYLRANRRYLALRVATHPSLLASPLIRDRIGYALRVTLQYSRVARATKTAPPSAPRFGVLAIATDPTVRGHGAGRALMIEAEQRARTAGHPRMLLTVNVENTRAIAFYEQLGWQRDASSGTWSGAMYKDLCRD